MKFQPGKSGNPDGRPVGSGDQTKRVQKLISNHIPQLAEILLSSALHGDQIAAAALVIFWATQGN